MYDPASALPAERNKQQAWAPGKIKHDVTTALFDLTAISLQPFRTTPSTERICVNNCEITEAKSIPQHASRTAAIWPWTCMAAQFFWRTGGILVMLNSWRNTQLVSRTEVLDGPGHALTTHDAVPIR